LLDCAVRFVTGRLLADGPDTTPAYTVTGGRVPRQRRLSLPGYPGGYNVVGNRVNQQFQLDAFSEPLLLLAAAANHDRLDSDAWRAAELAANAIAGCWRNPDAGIWELEPARWTHSALTCAAGLRQISHHAPRPRQASRWVQLADQIVARTARTGVHSSGRWQRAADDPRVDASLLLPAIRGAVTADDPRSLATLAAVGSELAEAGHAYRFRHDERPLGEAEGAFLICGFWLSLAHRRLGGAAASVWWFERTRAACGPPGLYSEEYDVAQRQLRGNIPQAFVHALLLECAAGQPG
jgi:GH15 family glucan-1,4-alpha-glucosidase